VTGGLREYDAAMKRLALLLLICAACGGKKPPAKPTPPPPPADQAAKPDPNAPKPKPETTNVPRTGDPCDGGQTPKPQ